MEEAASCCCCCLLEWGAAAAPCGGIARASSASSPRTLPLRPAPPSPPLPPYPMYAHVRAAARTSSAPPRPPAAPRRPAPPSHLEDALQQGGDGVKAPLRGRVQHTAVLQRLEAQFLQIGQAEPQLWSLGLEQLAGHCLPRLPQGGLALGAAHGAWLAQGRVRARGGLQGRWEGHGPSVPHAIGP